MYNLISYIVALTMVLLAIFNDFFKLVIFKLFHGTLLATKINDFNT